MKNFRDIYNKELKIVGEVENQVYTPLELVILDSSTVRMFVYGVCKEMLKEEDNKLRAKWFEKGQMSVKRKNKSGCCCIINDNDEVVSVCGAHETWMEDKCQS